MLGASTDGQDQEDGGSGPSDSDRDGEQTGLQDRVPPAFFNYMNIYLVAALVVLAAPIMAMSRSVCLEDKTPENALLTICEQTRGMAARPQPRLYLRVFNDGSAEYERNRAKRANDLELIEVFINGIEVQELVRFGESADLTSARDNYPAINRGTDSSTVTTITYRGLNGVKVITLNDYAPSAYDNYLHYPDSLNRLMYLAEEVRLRAFGAVRTVPAITYCEALTNSRQYLGKRISIYADLDYTGPRPYLTDECTTAAANAALPRRVGVGYNELGKKYGSISSVIENTRAKPYYGRARLLATGRLNDDGDGDDKYSFEIDEYRDLQQLVLPYQGTLKPGWTYSDTFTHPGGDAAITLSSPLKSVNHHALNIEWANQADLPRLGKPGPTGITFHVLSVTSKQIEKYLWNTTYTCEILSVGGR